MRIEVWERDYSLRMKIYFAGSIRAGREDAHLYARIVAILKKYGTVLTEHVGNPNLSISGSNGERESRDCTMLILHPVQPDWLDVYVVESSGI